MFAASNFWVALPFLRQNENSPSRSFVEQLTDRLQRRDVSDVYF
jgi:hypothetical protein